MAAAEIRFVVERVSDPVLLNEIAKLRYTAWAAGGEVPEFIAKQSMDSDEHDVHGMHWAVLHEGSAVAAARMCVHDNIAASPDPEAYDGYEHAFGPPIASITRLVVHPDFRKCGLAKMLQVARIEYARQLACGSIAGCAEEEYIMCHLEEHGFLRLGPTRIRYVAHAPSIVLCKTLSVPVLPRAIATNAEVLS
jgi:GNAT superfamily N-acetyltransferase